MPLLRGGIRFAQCMQSKTRSSTALLCLFAPFILLGFFNLLFDCCFMAFVWLLGSIIISIETIVGTRFKTRAFFNNHVERQLAQYYSRLRAAARRDGPGMPGSMRLLCWFMRVLCGYYAGGMRVVCTCYAGRMQVVCGCTAIQSQGRRASNYL